MPIFAIRQLVDAREADAGLMSFER